MADSSTYLEDLAKKISYHERELAKLKAEYRKNTSQKRLHGESASDYIKRISYLYADFPCIFNISPLGYERDQVLIEIDEDAKRDVKKKLKELLQKDYSIDTVIETDPCPTMVDL